MMTLASNFSEVDPRPKFFTPKEICKFKVKILVLYIITRGQSYKSQVHPISPKLKNIPQAKFRGLNF